ncbi:MAG: DUF2110 family protein [Candidatus Bathyarchaeota archaeon]|nr:MAG: DUF2110 family protein [Candidatus Bathyarchaeota archaeon]
MREVVLLQKIYRKNDLRKIKEILDSLCEGLKVRLEDLSVVENEWIKVRVSGEDEKVAVRLLERDVGLAPISRETVESFSLMRGKILASRRDKGVLVDIGIFLPRPIYASISLRRLQGQLIDGKKFALSRIVELFGLTKGFPLEIFISGAHKDAFKAELAESQLELYGEWTNSRIDRLLILGALSREVKKAIRKARLVRDVLRVEPLGIFEHAMICKLGTDASGLVPKLGRFIARAEFVCFSPRRILEVTEGRW